MKRVLLTGASGLIGRNTLKPLLDAGFEVCAVSRQSAPISADVRWLKADLLDFGGLEALFKAARANYWLHLAWDTGTGRGMGANTHFSWLSASLEMLRHFQAHGGERVVMAGTFAEYAPAAAPVREEDSPIEPQTVYAKCKDALNRLAALFCAENGISLGWGRAFTVYGANDGQPTRLTPSLVDALANGRDMTIRSGRVVRDNIYAEDAGAAFVKFLDGDVRGAVNISTGRGTRIEDYCRILAGLLGREALLHFEDAPGGQALFMVGDNRRLVEEVGFTPNGDLRGNFQKMLTAMGVTPNGAQS